MPLTKHSHTRGIAPIRPHREVAVKVNAMVDAGIAPLVLALSELPVWTLDSCQGRKDHLKDKPAHVYFRYQGNPAHEPLFIACLASAMGQRCQEESLYRLQMEWTGGESPLGIIECSPTTIEQVAALIRAASSDARMTSFLHGRGCKALRS
jgi:hypothetical protein